MNAVIDFLQGILPFEQFEPLWKTDEKLLDWVDGLCSLRELKPEWDSLPYGYVRATISKHFNGSFKEWELYNRALKERCIPICVRKSALFNSIAGVVVVAFPTLKLSTEYEKGKNFYYAVVSNTFGGDEVSNFIDSVVNSYVNIHPVSVAKASAKKALRESFHIIGKNFPRWVQEPEWPMGDETPMQFVSQSRIGDKVEFLFEDYNSKKEKKIVQFY